MCGIAGRFSPAGPLPEGSRVEVEAMTQHLRHRGPDDGGLLDRAPLAVLGHRRLAIIDVAEGKQPMGYGDSLWITYNGEIYNYRSLRDELAARGHRFATSSDTEVVLAAYREWGEECPTRLEGMFAFAILDVRERRLFLARDHLGKKPLYVRWRNGILDFASELAALRHAADWRGDLDPLAWAFYLRLGYVPSPWTVYRGVEKLRPAESFTVDPAGARRRTYWTISAAPRARASEDVVDELEALLEDAVRARLMSEVPLGAFLSGGIDSGLVVAAMAKLCGGGVRTSTVGFADEPGGGEIEAARLVARQHRTDHEEIEVRSGVAPMIGRVAGHFGEPFADSSAIPTWHISRETRKRVTVALTGDGGDEPFGGYDFRYLPHRRDARLRSALPRWLRRPLFAPLAGMWPRGSSLPRALRLQTVLRNLAVEEDEAFYLDLCFTPPSLAAALAPDIAGYGDAVEEHVRAVYRSGNGADALERIMLADVKLYLPEDVLVKADRMSMAHGLEVRSPLLSKRIVEFAFSIPSGMKIRGRTSKAVLRELAARRLPPGILSLPKRGFHAPLDRWFRGELGAAFASEVLSADGDSLGWVDVRKVRDLFDAHRQGRMDCGTILWSVWALRAWVESVRHPEGARLAPALRRVR
ncbi:MAG: asparagine synthase (glutamine-hydrolyzing) [Candidatus Binatia bacterium]